MEQRTIRSGSPFEVLALAEHTLGFRPRESLLVVSLRPPRWRTGLVARADLADVRAQDGVELLASHLRADGAARAFVAVITDEGSAPPAPRRPPRRRRPRRPDLPRPRRGPDDGGGRSPRLRQLPGAEVARRVSAALLAEGVEPELWLVHRGRLLSYTCSCDRCPPDGLPLSEVDSTATAFHRVLAGRALAGDRDALVQQHLEALAPADPDGVAAVGAALGEVEREWTHPAVTSAEASPPVLALALWRTLVSRPLPRGTFGQLLEPSEAGPRDALDDALDDDLDDALTADDEGRAVDLAPEEAARLVDALSRLPLRDVLLGLLVPDAVGPCSWGCDDGPLPPVEPCALCWWAGRAPTGPALGPPEPQRALAVLTRLARLAPAGRRAAVLGCSAYLLWATGRSLPAGVHAEQALLDDPDHSLSRLVLHGVRVGVRPPVAEGALDLG